MADDEVRSAIAEREGRALDIERVASVAIAGVTMVHVVESGIRTDHVVRTGWRNSRRVGAPVLVRHRVCDVTPPDTATRMSLPARGTYHIESGGRRVAVSASVTGGDGTCGQLLRIKSPDREYELCYEHPTHARLLRAWWERLILTTVLSEGARGLAIHAAAVMLPSRGVLLFPGISGAGKSTVARMFHEWGIPGVRVLGDDCIAVTREDDRFVAWGTPWVSSLGISSPDDGPLVGVVYPARGPGGVLRHVSASEHARRLLRTLALPFWSGEGMTSASRQIDDLVAAVPAFEYLYTPSPTAAESLLSAFRPRPREVE